MLEGGLWLGGGGCVLAGGFVVWGAAAKLKEPSELLTVQLPTLLRILV